MDRMKVVVHGAVQGVGFRHFIRSSARALGLRGWVLNREDGGVEFEAEGGREALERLLAMARRGPGHAGVVSVDADWSNGPARYEGFDVRLGITREPGNPG